MDFRISYTFTDSLAHLTGDEQKAVKTTAFDLQLNPANPGMQFHKLDRAKDKNFWSVRVSKDIRLIVHKTAGSLLLCYVDHHDKAYAWAERRKLEIHPKTGAAQFVEVREMVQQILIPQYIDAPEPPKPAKPLFANVPNDDLLSYGVPADLLGEVRQVTEDTLLAFAEHLPAEAAEALLNLATGTIPVAVQPSAVGADPFKHPDALRRFRVVSNTEELARALDYPWEKWTVFLHPSQRESVERDYGGPARVSGSAGTGKTVVALHRAVFLARAHPEARVLLTTFSETLANALRTKLFRLIGNEPRIGERVEVHSLNGIAKRLHELNIAPAKIASRATVAALLADAAGKSPESKFSQRFLASEWEDIVDAWQLDTWESYRDVNRLGRKTRLPEKKRHALWTMFSQVRAGLNAKSIMTYADLFSQVATFLAKAKAKPFEFVVVDEAQDIGVAQLRFLAALGSSRPNGMFFTGDLGQRIFQQPFSWKSLGVDIRGRSKTLKINYRTSHQIRAQADRLLGPAVADVDGNSEDRKGTISVFNGPEPEIKVLASASAEIAFVGQWLAARLSEGIQPHEIGLFVRSPEELDRAREAIGKAKIPFKTLDDAVETVSGHASLCTMHLAKGLEFRSVAVMACDDEIVPLQERIEAISDDSDLEEVYSTERHLLYVACTRARDHLLVTSASPASEFLDDLVQRVGVTKSEGCSILRGAAEAEAE